jgi:aspartyl aminopeptidase
MTDFFSFLDESPLAFHAAENIVSRFQKSGWTLLEEKDTWSLKPASGYLVRLGPGAVAAFTLGRPGQADGWRIAAAHTDSPGLKIKLGTWQNLNDALVRWGVEVYGSPLFSTWTDRSLGIAGTVWVQAPEGPRAVALKTESLAVIPNLALHYNRDANKGTGLDPQTQLSALVDPGAFPNWRAWLAHRTDNPEAAILTADLSLYDPQPACLNGPSGLYQSGRIDNLAGSHAVLKALLATGTVASPAYRLALFLDNEEIGSETPQGASSSLLPRLLERLDAQAGLDGELAYRQRWASFLVSVDAAHGVHPNYPDRHDPAYSPKLGQGPVLKAAARGSYATTAQTEALFRWKTSAYKNNLQNFIMRSDLIPGSTVGPLLAAKANLPAVDLGVPLWAMHSVRETGHLADQAAMIELLTVFWG